MSLLALAEGLGGSVRALGVEARLERAKLWLAGDGDPRARLDFTGGRQFVLVIDEINRANVARVMGELWYHPARRRTISGSAAPTRWSCACPRAELAVPPNLHVIGTLNTADRSIALMDVALRRRFAFEEKRPNIAVLHKTLPAGKALTALVVELFTTINQRLLFLHDREHQIGHAYFLKVPTIEDLRDVMVEKVLPLLPGVLLWPVGAHHTGAGPPDGGRRTDAEVDQQQQRCPSGHEDRGDPDTRLAPHLDYEDRHTIEVHSSFKSGTAREWLVKALVAIVEIDATKGSNASRSSWVRRSRRRPAARGHSVSDGAAAPVPLEFATPGAQFWEIAADGGKFGTHGGRRG